MRGNLRVHKTGTRLQSIRPTEIAFGRELGRGIVAYNESVGHWWMRQAGNPSHRNAYRNIARFIGASFHRPPGRIVDYACGAGHLLAGLHRTFPTSKLVGYDGSALLLARARKILTSLGTTACRHMTLMQTLLPDFELPTARADLVLYVFPNLVPGIAGANPRSWESRLSRAERLMAQSLAKRRDAESTRKEDDPGLIYATLVRDRLVSLNLRQLVKRSGTCIRVEYANVPRDELPELEMVRTAFEEGSLDQCVDGVAAEPWFRVVASRYHRSGVIEDVYHQSSDADHRTGGYLITVLRAL